MVAQTNQLPPQEAEYVLGHAPQELARLIDQGRFLGDLTEHALHLAGIVPGMRVLDVGCGVGDVSFLAAQMVGPQGMVIGVDKSAGAIAMAQQRAEQAKLDNVHFKAADVEDFTLEQPVDALIGRLILMYFSDPAAILRHLLGLVKPGGVVVFQEMDMMAAKSEPIVNEYDIAGERIRQTFTRVGIDICTGLKLSRIFQEAGLIAPQMLQMARVECGPHSSAYSYMEQTTRSLLPAMEQTGVANAESVAVDTLASRVRAETQAKNAVLVPPALIGAWCRT